MAEFKRGRKSLGVDECLGRPNAATTDGNIAKVHQMGLDNHRIKVRDSRGAYYASLLDKLKVELEEKQPHLQKKKILFHQDNALSHTSAATMAKIHELRFELLDHPPYSPDLASSDFFLFPHLKIALGGQRFLSNEEAIPFVNNYFAEKNAEYYLDELQR
ncbi:histone-lysine N-methyltransferase SETMAR [Trichonephila clavipes]|nr:histone-lysine N-methyltransferase SETMAR [Trichonephila clavipes]